MLNKVVAQKCFVSKIFVIMVLLGLKSTQIHIISEKKKYTTIKKSVILKDQIKYTFIFGQKITTCSRSFLSEILTDITRSLTFFQAFVKKLKKVKL